MAALPPPILILVVRATSPTPVFTIRPKTPTPYTTAALMPALIRIPTSERAHSRVRQTEVLIKVHHHRSLLPMLCCRHTGGEREAQCMSAAGLSSASGPDPPRTSARSAARYRRSVSYPRLSEVGTRRCHRLQFDRAEPVGKMHGEYGDKDHDRHGNTGERDERANEDREPSEEFDENRHPRQ
jgi:hypothetical protein